MTTETTRYHGLDLLRAVAMLLGIVFHAPIIYYIPEMADGFREFGISTDMIPKMELWLQILTQWTHNWRMPVFFMISGFFALMVFERRGPGYLFKDRFVRLGLTMIIFASLMDMLDGHFAGQLNHFWFLYYLIIITFLASIIWAMMRPASEGVAAWRVSNGLFTALLLALIPVRMLCDQLDGGAIRIAETYIDIKFGGLIYFARCFLVGAALYIRRDLLAPLSRRSNLMIVGLFAVGAFILTFQYVDGFFGHRRSPDISLTDTLLGSVFAASSAVLWCMFMLGASHALVTHSTALIRWLVELSYPVYILHLVPAMLVSAILIGQGFSQLMVVSGTIIATFVISMIGYYVLIKFTPLSWIINGYRKSWLKLPFGQHTR
ncbi:acyltransferase family protein [Candidatus Puniceispirillum marinum]|uniref:MDO-like protein n=1 Tax=Puniceispirillum marinum (strain IMCC1322) TaxID=488538 RepID=D5BSF2_PUNMI|nr:acyltransferase family protein [Candidatus Puniceispirillum marinum]ADE39199.1 MDO-like protein [Candidatus Puniceispirillum marinum IMCC1322]